MGLPIYPLTFVIVSRDIESSSYSVRNSFTCYLSEIVSVGLSSALISQRSKRNCFSSVEEQFFRFGKFLDIHWSVSLPAIVSFSAGSLYLTQIFAHDLLQGTHNLQAPWLCQIPELNLVNKLTLKFFLMPNVFMN